MEKVKPYLAIFTTIVLFSTIEVAVVAIRGTVNPYFLAVLRFGIAGIVMSLIELKKLKSIPAKELLPMILIGVIGLAGTFGPYHLILEYDLGTVPQVALIFSLNPIFASLIAVPLLKERIDKNHIFALVLGFVGAYVVLFGFSVVAFDSLKGPLWMIWTAFAFGAYTTFSKQVVMKHGPLLTTGVAFICAAVTLLIAMIIQNSMAETPVPVVDLFKVTEPMRAIPVLLYLIFFTTLAGYGLYFYGLKRVPVSAGTAMFYLKPILATIFALIFLSNTPIPEAKFYIGMAIIFIALSLSMKKGKK